MSKGKLIVLEGLDGSGKATQAKLLAEHLAAQGVPVQKITFPDYASDSSSLVKMYLAGPLRLPAFPRWTAMPAIKPAGAAFMSRAV